MQLKSVDLPQPFGPISPRISPSCTSKLTPSTALMPPKLFLMLADFEDRGHGAVSSLDLATARSADAALVRRSAR